MDVWKFNEELNKLKGEIINLRDKWLDEKVENVQREINRLLDDNNLFASQIQTTLTIQQEKLEEIKGIQEALGSVERFRHELTAVKNTLKDEQLLGELQVIETRINLLDSRTQIDQINNTLIIQRSRLDSIESRQIESNTKETEKRIGLETQEAKNQAELEKMDAEDACRGNISEQPGGASRTGNEGKRGCCEGCETANGQGGCGKTD